MISTGPRPQTVSPDAASIPAVKPLLRGWFHAAAALAAAGFTVALCLRAHTDVPRMISLLVFGLAMIELYAVSALYHIGAWSPPRRRVLRALDHANIFVLIAGTYTPLCLNVLAGWPRVALLAAIWTLTAVGIGVTLLAPDLPRWVGTTLYVGMGWVAIFALPAFLAALPWSAVATLLLGGLLYTLGGVVYALRRPDPFPRILGFHEVFHLFVLAGGVALAVMVWLWVVPFPRV
jgi:hemolysin III